MTDAEIEPGEKAGDSASLERAQCARPLKAYLGIGAATVLWASNAVAVKIALREFPTLAMAALRVTLAAAALTLLVVALGRGFRLGPGEGRRFLKLGLWGLALSFLFFTLGLEYSSVSHVVFIGALVPLVVLLLARIYGLERITLARLTGLLISLAGIFLLSLDQAPGEQPHWKGDLMALLGVGCFSFYTVQSKKVVAEYGSLRFNHWIFLAGALWLLPLFVVEVPRVPWSEITWVGWCSLLFSATFGSAGPYLAYFYCLRSVPASQVAAFHYLQPVLATALGSVLLQESLSSRFAAGAALILAGVFLAERH